MKSFIDFCTQINGEMYKNVPPPVAYDLEDFASTLTSSPINGTETGSHELIPLTDEDMARYGADDVSQHYAHMHNGQSPSRIGEPMTDSEFKKFMGHSW